MLLLVVVLGRGQRRRCQHGLLLELLPGLLVYAVAVEACGSVLRLKHLLRRLLGVDNRLILELSLLSEEVQGLVPVRGILELSIGGRNAWRDHKVVLTGHHHSVVVLLPVRHAPVNLPIPVNLELTSVLELVLPRVGLRLLLLPVLLQRLHLAAAVIILAVGA